jgi:thymidylate synthase (FAD)
MLQARFGVSGLGSVISCQINGVVMASVVLEAVTPDAELLIESACRTCYLSFHRQNPPDSTRELITKILRKGHHSVLEHVCATFRVSGGSRVFTHELVRHRFISPSQESQRYVRYGKRTPYAVVVPDTIADAGFADEFERACHEAHRLYEQMVVSGVPKEDARYVLPNATTSQIVITANFRELRHFFTLRCNLRAHWEIRQVAILMLRVMKDVAPIVFYDFEIAKDGQSARLTDPESYYKLDEPEGVTYDEDKRDTGEFRPIVDDRPSTLEKREL